MSKSKHPQKKSDPSSAFLTIGDNSGLNLFERAVEKLGNAIKMGVFAPGDQLPPERDLAEMMGISRSTVRAAIGILVDGGFVVSKRGRSGGTFVSEQPPGWPEKDNIDSPGWNEKSARHFIEKRTIIESGIAFVAAQRADEYAVRDLRALVGEMSEHIGNFDKFREIDAKFHLMIAQITENPELIKVTAEIQNSLGSLFKLLPPSKQALLHSNQQHAEIVSSISKGDAETARKISTDHVNGTQHFLSGLLPK